jgi:translation elongation factor EF-Tu-like GTPase
MVDDPKIIELVEMEIRELLDFYEFDGSMHLLFMVLLWVQ